MQEADFYYVPIYVACLTYPILGAADFPFFHGYTYGNRAQHSSNMQEEAWLWLRSHMPYWDRNGGRDHIVLSPHDEGTCYGKGAVYK